jgi:GGDEF domain-containing protein
MSITTPSRARRPLEWLTNSFRSSSKPASEARDSPAPEPHTAPDTSDLADPHTGLYNHRGLALKGDALLARLKREGLPACVVELDCSELRTVRDICGRVAAQKLLCHVASRVTRLVGARGLAARSASTQFTLVLAGTREEVARAIEAEFGSPPRIAGDKATGVRMLNLRQVSIKQVHDARQAAAAIPEPDKPSEPSSSSSSATIFLDSTSSMPINCAATQPIRVGIMPLPARPNPG